MSLAASHLTAVFLLLKLLDRLEERSQNESHGSHLNFFIIRHIPVILYSRLLSLPELNEESRPQCHKYSEEYGCRVVNYIRRLNNIIP